MERCRFLFLLIVGSFWLPSLNDGWILALAFVPAPLKSTLKHSDGHGIQLRETVVTHDGSQVKDDTTSSKQPFFLLHEGVTASFMPKWPAIVTYTLVKGWTDETTKHFCNAVNKVLELNPILTGRVYRHKPFPIFHPRREHLELRVQPGYFGKEHDFVTVVDAPTDMLSPDILNCTAALELIQEQIIPFMGIHCESTGTEIAKKLPLFSAHVMRLPNDYACFALKLSHCLGDGLTYYHVMDQVMHFLSNAKLDGVVMSYAKQKDAKGPPVDDFIPPRIDWNHPLKATHECFPETFSRRDVRNSYGWPFYVGLFRNFKRLIDPKFSRLYVMRRDKIDAVKKEYLKSCPKGTIISANDLITAGLCQSNESTDIFSFPLNMRGRKEGMNDPMAAGYLCCEIPFPKEAAREPLGMRKIVSEKQYYDTDKVPMKPFFEGRNGRISNFASIRSNALFENRPAGLEVICHCMPVNFFEIFPIDVCMIFRIDKEHLGVMHNFANYTQNELLDNMTVFTLEPKN